MVRAGGTNYTGAIPIKADKKRSLKLYKFHIFLLSSVGRAGGTNYTGAIPIKADKKRSLKLYKFHIFLLSSVGRAPDC